MHGCTRLTDERGFTFVEVLVVMLILGILAGIAVSQLKPNEANAQDADAKMAVSSMHAHVQSCFVETEDYGVCESSDPLLGDSKLPVGSGVGQVRADSKSAHEVTIAARSRSGTTFFLIKAAGKDASRTCDRDYGGCRTGGW